jgi:long-subunit fatty acid transport protein
MEFDVDWTDWDNVNEIVIRGTAGGDRLLPLNYQSSLMYEFGITRTLDNGFFISTGYIFSENSIPDKDFNPIVPDSDLHLGSIGFGRRGKHWDWAVAYHFAYNPERVVSDSQTTSLIGETADGTYKTFNQAATISATFKF